MRATQARRALSLALATLAIVATVGLIVQGARCGMSSSRAECAAGEECAPPVTGCETYIHPFAWALLAGSVAALAAAWHGSHMIALALGVALGAVGGLLGMSLGYWGVGIALLIVSAGAVLPHARPVVAGSALVATLLPFVLLLSLMLTYQARWSGFGKIPGPHPTLVISVAVLPGALWTALVIAARRRA